VSKYTVDVSDMTQFLLGLLNILSPSGDTERAVAYVRKAFDTLGLETALNAKGALIATWKGQSSERPRALTAHVDTLGAMVKEIKSRGTILPTQASQHVHSVKQVGELERNAQNIEVRLDARTHSADETRALGIEVGDFCYLDPRAELTDTGFVRSRHLDDKASRGH